jgi:hypothetical protein
MPRRRILVQLPQDVADGIDKLVGSRKRAAFVAEQLRHELQRRQQLAALDAAAGSWKEEGHPELAQGGAAYIEKIRNQDRLLEKQRMDHFISSQD